MRKQQIHLFHIVQWLSQHILEISELPLLETLSLLQPTKINYQIFIVNSFQNISAMTTIKSKLIRVELQKCLPLGHLKTGQHIWVVIAS